jgi:hypothetical protein
MNDHLTSAQLDHLLFDLEATNPHLRDCELCRAELASLRSTFGGLRSGATLAAARHQRLAALPQRSARPVRLIGSLAAAAVVLAVSLPVALRHPSPAHPNIAQAPQTNPATTSTAAANLSDEQLLTTVQGDLAASVPDSMLPLDASTSTATK